MKKTINKLRIESIDLYDLQDWRKWFSNVISLIFVILFPVSFIYIFPDFISRGLIYIVVIDIVIWLILFLRVFVPVISNHFPDIIWVIIVYLMTVSYLVMLGPGYARPAWLMLCVVIAAIFHGVRGAIISSILNGVILSSLFFLFDPINDSWVSVHEDGMKNWATFTANMVLLSVCASVSVGFLINRLNKSLHIERDVKEELHASNEELSATVEELEAINEEFEIQNRELTDSTVALRKSEHDLMEIFNSSHDALIIHDSEGVILDINKPMLVMFGVSRDQVFLMNISDILTSDDWIKFKNGDWSRVISGESPVYELKAQRPGDKFIFDVEVSLRKLNWRGKEVILASIRDLTDRKNAEAEREQVQAQLVQAQKMEAVGTLAGGIAHDFNNVLSVISGSLDLIDILLKSEDRADNAEIGSYLHLAIESSKRAADITRQLLVLSRKREMKMTAVQIKNSIDNVMNICRSSFPKLVDLDFRDVDPSLMVVADATQIEQVILNLCMNASHSMTIMRSDGEQQGGRLTVDAGLYICDRRFCVRHQDSVPGTAYVQIRVSDTGIGINEEEIRRIFEPFYTTKQQHEGTGLGLAITYSIVSRHGGFIDVNSEPGRGTLFTVYLPHLESQQADVVKTGQNIIRGTGRILVVDDEESVLHIAKGMLERCGYSVVTANGAAPGIELLRKSPDGYDAVVLDNSMPGMSGLEVYIEMKKIVPDLRVILCSGFMDEETVKKCSEIGIREFIDKPYGIEEFSVSISNLLK